MLRNILSFAAKAVLGLGVLAWPISSTALARGQGHSHSRGGSSHGGTSSGHHGGNNNWNHGNHGYYGGYYRGYPYLYNFGYGYRFPYRGGYGGYGGGGYYPYADDSYYPEYGYDDSYGTAGVEPARITVQVPPDATVMVNGVQMNRSGNVRQYVTPPLESGYQYSYEVRASWMTPSGPVNNSRTVWVNPGDNLVVNLNRVAPAQ